MLLPHGYEGQGPEHSSARLERYLQSCAEFNIAVANITTPANFFHVIRRQLIRPFRKPLVVMTPKSLLRHPAVISPIKELTSGKFKEIIDDTDTAKKVRRILFCSGKIYYDLLERKNSGKHQDVAIVRIEQLFPLPFKQLEKIIKAYQKGNKDVEVYWVQEEPSNMGSWTYMLGSTQVSDFLYQFKWNLVARKASASPATGFKKVHLKEQDALVTKAFKK